MANAVLTQIALQQRIEQIKVARLGEAQMAQALLAARSMDDVTWAAFLREAFAVIIGEFAPVAAAVSAAFYDRTRETWIEEHDVNRVPSFAAEAAVAMEAKDRIIESRRAEMGFFIDQVFKGEMTRAQVETPTKQLASTAVIDFAREVPARSAERDRFAESTTRVVRKGGCDFCKTMSLASYTDGAGENDDGEAFHKGCSCSTTVTFQGGDPEAYWQDWMYEFQDEMTAARESLIAQQFEVNYGQRYDATRKSTKTGRDKSTTRTFRPAELSITNKNLIREMRAARSGKQEDKAEVRQEELKDRLVTLLD